ncbi:MAG: hypothetical protein D6793_09335 [Thermoflexia bacterium]|nr:MAG: hypothetical protein D6793_09335 [Thermoflexia bacterium]
MVSTRRSGEKQQKNLEVLVWGYRLDPHNWEKRGRTLVEQAISPDTLKDLVDLFGREPEAWWSLL